MMPKQTQTNPPHTPTTKAKSILRLAPCPSYDIEGLESWLSDMAQKGYHLKKKHIYWGVFGFTKGAAQQTTYRLEAAGNNTIWDDNNNLPDQDMVTLYSELGWEHIARYQNFDIYAATDATPRELNTDPILQALTLNSVKKRQINAMFFGPMLQCLLLILLCQKELMQYALSVNSVCIFSWLLLLLHWFCGAIFEIIHLSKLRKTLSKTGELNHKKHWSTNQRKHFLRIGTTWGLLLVLASSYAFACYVNASDARVVAITDYDQDPPFATLTSTPTADYFAIYDVYLGVTFVIQQGDTLACVTFYDYANEDDTTAPFTIEECVEMVAQSLLA